jgi:hypothetical protein
MLEKLRAKPDHIKQTISVILSLIIFSGILFVWVSSRDARSRELEVRDKTVSPAKGVSSMFDGYISEAKQAVSHLLESKKSVQDEMVATSTPVDTFDFSGVVIFDQTSSSTKLISSSTTSIN